MKSGVPVLPHPGADKRFKLKSAISDERMPSASNGAAQSGMAALVIVFGNPLREDDGVGWAVAEALRARGRVAVRAVHQLGPELAEMVGQASRVVFADARHGGRPGAVRSRALSPASTSQELTHALDPRALLLYSQLVYGRGWRLSPAEPFCR